MTLNNKQIGKIEALTKLRFLRKDKKDDTYIFIDSNSQTKLYITRVNANDVAIKYTYRDYGLFFSSKKAVKIRKICNNFGIFQKNALTNTELMELYTL